MNRKIKDCVITESDTVDGKVKDCVTESDTVRMGR